MDKEKFMESFVKRFANNVEGTRDYDIKVYDINETPPKVSIRVISPKNTVVVKALGGENKVDITTTADMIIETKNKDNLAVTTKNKDYIKDLKITSYNGLNNLPSK
jgi:hypothetical protein